MSRIIDLTGQKFGKLTVIKMVESDSFGQTRWLCRCKCGTERIVLGGNLKRKYTVSCGCHKKENFINRITIHGLKTHKLYSVWEGMIQRCYNPNNIEYHNYGGRGITVCDEWRNDFKTFYDWAMNNGFIEEKLENGRNKYSIDRINNDGNYEPSNCRFSTPKQQSNNMRTNVLITYCNETKTISQWSEKLNINYNTLYSKLKKGINIENLIKQKC